MGVGFYLSPFTSTISLFFLISLLSLHHHPNSAAKNKSKFTQGPVTNVTKSLSFHNFNLKTNPRLPQDIKLLGSATFSTQNGSIQIPDPTTKGAVDVDLKHQAGRAIYSSPIRLLDPHTKTPASFQTTFSFQFTANNLSEDAVGGSGLTFIIVPDELTVGRPGAWLAMMNDACDDDYKAVAVEFDTRQNVDFGDPNDNHVGINLGSIVSSTTINASDVGVSLKDGSIHRAWINYDGMKRWIEIRLGSDGGDFPTKPMFSSSLDISPYLKEYMFVGFSASTGNKTQIHNVLAWNFSSTSQAFLQFPTEEACEKKLLKETISGKPPTGFLIFVSVVVLLLAVLLNFYCSSRRKDPSQISTVTMILPEKKQRPGPPNKPRRFTFSEISTATRQFSEGQVLSSDSRRALLYKGAMANGCQVVIMRFSTHFLNNSPGLDRKRLMKEIGKFGRIRHPNLVGVRGWCCDNKEIMVVYDHFSNGCLDRWLFGVGVLPWTRRFKMIKDVADSLSYLHSKKLAHRNVNTSSVFLDITFRAVLGDFGFGESKRADSDVFEFGLVVLEIVSGRRKEEEEQEMGLLDFAWRMHEIGELRNVVDQRMGSVFNSEQAIRVVQIGLLCTLNASSRPSMEDVVGFLNNMDAPIPELPPSRPVSLFPYSSGTHLCGAYTCTPFN